MFWEKGGKNFEAQIFLVTKAVGTTLDDTDFVVRALNKSEANFIVHFTVGNNALPVAFDHGGEFFQGAQSLPAELSFPVVKELSGPCRALIGPKVAEGFFEQVSLEQSCVGSEKSSQRLASLTAQVVPFALARCSADP